MKPPLVNSYIEVKTRGVESKTKCRVFLRSFGLATSSVSESTQTVDPTSSSVTLVGSLFLSRNLFFNDWCTVSRNLKNYGKNAVLYEMTFTVLNRHIGLSISLNHSDVIVNSGPPRDVIVASHSCLRSALLRSSTRERQQSHHLGVLILLLRPHDLMKLP